MKVLLPTRRSFIAGAASLIASPAIVRAQMAAIGAGGGNKAPSSGFTPANLTNLVAWYKADTGVTTSSGNVTQVLDQSGNGNTLTNNGTVPFTTSSAYNSHNAFGFAAANGAALKSGAAAVALPSSSALSVFMVCQITSSASGSPGGIVLAVGANNDFNDAGNILPISTNGVAASPTLESVYNGSIVDTSGFTVSTNKRVGVVVGSGTVTHYINNVAGSTGSYTLALTTPTNIIIGNRFLSGAIGGTGNCWDGPILEIVITAAAMSATDRNNLDTYFTNRLGT